MNEELKNSLDSLAGEIDSKIETKSMEVVETIKADNANKVQEVETKIEAMAKRLDDAEMINKKAFEAKAEAPMSFKSALEKAIEDGGLESFKKNGNAELILKADMKISSDFTGDVIQPTRVDGVKFDPSKPSHIREILPIGSTDSDVVRYVKETAYSDGSSFKQEGATLGQTDFELEAKDANVRKLGTYLRVSEEMMDDYKQLVSYLSARVPNKIMAVEDTQILNGNGSNPNLSGLFTDGTAFSAGSFSGAVSNANEFDVLVASMNQLALANYQADYIVLNPTDFHKILLLKDTTNQYLKDQVYAGLQPNFMGVPVILNTACTAGKFLVGNFALGTQLWVREGISLGIFREDGINVREGFVTIRVKERVALTNYNPNAFVQGTFSSAITAITV
tara:strand:+ start:1679 stop:2857 length:1179 start_codon:yes stop_codon:yes gene_type:complete